MTPRIARLAPTLLVLLIALAYLGGVLIAYGGDPLAFARIGTRFSEGDPGGTEGYDGQFNYFIALNPDPQTVSPRIDVPAYRYQHILYPLLARAAALGNPDAIPWSLVVLNVIFLGGFVFLTGELIAARGGSRWAVLPIGLWVGLIGAVRLDLAEPLAMLLVAAAVLASGNRLDERIPLAATLLGIAMFAKETTLPFILGWILWLVFRRQFGKAACFLAALVPFAVFQVWLWSVFGSPGLGSGGAGATAFEGVPFLGLLRVAEVNLKVLAMLLIVYVPGLLIPAVYGLVAPLWDLSRRRIAPEGILLFFNSLMVALAPFSTFREPLGITRLACGLILCMGLYAAAEKKDWWRKLSLVGIVYLAFILN